jgi:hypothetical protein
LDNPGKEQKGCDDAIRTIVEEAVELAKLEGYEQGYADGKRQAAN